MPGKSPFREGPEFIKLMIGNSHNYKPIEGTILLGQRDFRSFENYKYIQTPQFKIIKTSDTKQWFIEGCKNVRNNTRLNGKVITGKTAPLSPGDIISIGPFKTKVAF
jgi:hypothetical protein